MILVLSKLALAGSLFFLIGFLIMFVLTVLAAANLQKTINKAKADGKGNARCLRASLRNGIV